MQKTSSTLIKLINQYPQNIFEDETISTHALLNIGELNSHVLESILDLEKYKTESLGSGFSPSDYQIISNVKKIIYNLDTEFSLKKPVSFYKGIYKKDILLKRNRNKEFENEIINLKNNITKCIDIFINITRLLKFELSNDLNKFLEKK